MISAEKARELLDAATLGPWCADSSEVYGARHEWVAEGLQDDDELMEANTALIAAAPGLAETVIAQAEQIADLREMIDGQAWEDLHAEVVQLRHDVSILQDERDFLRGRDERSLEQDGADGADDEPQGTDGADLAAALQASLDVLQARRRAESAQ